MMNKLLEMSEVCNRNSNLKAHVKKFHPEKIDKMNAQKNNKCVAICNECSKTFSNKSSWAAHVRKFHTDKQEILLPKKVYNHKCGECGKNFSHLKDYNWHMKTHQENLPSGSKDWFKCTLCGLTESVRSEIFKHFEETHDISISSETFSFATKPAFIEWKSNMEKVTKSTFIKQNGTRNSSNVGITYYKCHRSGTYKSKGKGIRRLKIQGSNKINGFCPANIKLISYENGKCEVVFTKTHVGHDNDLSHIHLTSSERMALASKIAQKIPFQAILDEIRDSVTNCNLGRLHLLTRKDLYNIEQGLKLNNDAVRHKNDAISIESWVSEMEENGCILLYKAQDTVCEKYAQLQKKDFVLIIMTEDQLDLLQKYGSDCICIDSTHGINESQFELTTLFVLDDVQEGFPCAFLISNRTDEEVLKIFFLHVREKLEKQLQSTVFMSDMAASFYNAWIKVMLPTTFRLFCTWHVDAAWMKNLNSKIESKEERAGVYKQLRTILQERDINTFKIMVTNFAQSLISNERTKEFGQYFESHYLNTAESWAYCFHVNAGLNTNVHIERMHRTLEYLYLNGKDVKRLDKAINAIMKFTRDRFLERLLILSKDKISAKIKDIRSRHKTSKALNINTISPLEYCWQVPSSSTTEIYIVEERMSKCDCKLLCTDCNVCLHRYSCTCMDCSINWNMCKHIHLVCQFRKRSAEPAGELRIQSTSGQDDDESKFVDKEEGAAIIKSVTKYEEVNANVAATLCSEQEKLIASFAESVRSTVSMEEIEAIKHIVAPINPTVMSLRKNADVQLSKKGPSTSTNKNIKPNGHYSKRKRQKI